MAKDLGKVCMVSKGAYSSTTQYEVLDLVTYNGGLYCAKKAALGKLPTNEEYWFVASKGAYMIAKDAGFTGTEAEFNSTIGQVPTVVSRAESDHTQAVTDHGTASGDHTQAVADHGVAAADHTIAQTDHSTAQSDHGIASTDHTTASADHTQAASDHQTASADHTQATADHEWIHGKVIGYEDVETIEYDGSVDGQPVAQLRQQLQQEVTNRTNADATEKTERQNADANLQSQINQKQGTISDLDTIRSNAEAGKAHSDTAHAPANAQKNVQSDWDATSGDAFIKNKPTSMTPTAHTHTKAEVTDFAHNHDDRYYTESEIDTKLNGKSNTGHTHTKSEITDFAHNHEGVHSFYTTIQEL